MKTPIKENKNALETISFGVDSKDRNLILSASKEARLSVSSFCRVQILKSILNKSEVSAV